MSNIDKHPEYVCNWIEFATKADIGVIDWFTLELYLNDMVQVDIS